MTIRRFGVFILVVGLLVAGAGRNAAAAFAQLFQVNDVKGSCTAVLPQGGTKPLQSGEGLAYGATLATSMDGALAAALTPDGANFIMLGGNASLGVAEDASAPNQKLLNLFKGKVEINLAKGFEAENSLKTYTRCINVTATEGGAHLVEATMEADLYVAVITVTSGKLSAEGPYFTMAELDAGDSVSIACSKDGDFVRIRCLTGKYDMGVHDSTGNPRVAEMVQDSVIKILRKPSDAAMETDIVTVLQIDPEGNVVQADTYTTPSGKEPPTLQGEEPDVPGEEGEDKPGTPQFPTTTSPTTTSTSTTTVPPGDLIPTTTKPPTSTTRPPISTSRRSTSTTRPPPPPTTTQPPYITPVGQT